LTTHTALNGIQTIINWHGKAEERGLAAQLFLAGIQKDTKHLWGPQNPWDPVPSLKGWTSLSSHRSQGPE